MNYFAELKRRSVYRVAVAYLVVSWGLIQFTAILMDVFGLPEWTARLVFIILALGLVPTLIAAWALELTPEGIKLDKDVDHETEEYRRKGRRLNYLIIGALLFIIVLLAVERAFLAVDDDVSPATTTVVDVERSVAVLPFADLSQQRDQEWFGDGISEEIINALARTPDIMVAARTSAFAYKDSDAGVSTIGQELGVAHVLEGSIRTSGDNIRVTAQLIRVSDGFHLWSQTYDRSMDNIIGIQEDVAVQIASALETTMNPEALEDMMLVGTRSVRAYQAYILGVSLQSRSIRTADPQYLLEAYEQFELARDIDPKFATAHRQAADFWRIQMNPALLNSGLTDLTAVEMYRNFLERIDLAVDTATNDIDRSSSRGQRAAVQLRLRNAIRRFREYLEARPNDTGAWSDLLRVALVARDEQAVADSLEVLKSRGKRNRTAAALYMNFAHRVLDAPAAADYGLTALERWPNDAGISYQTHRSLLWAMRIDEAAHLLDRIDPIVADRPIIKARQACAEGRREDVLRMLEAMQSAERRSVVQEWLVLMMLDRKDAAEELLSGFASSEVPYRLASWLVYPMFDPRPFPALVKMLEREKIERPPPVAIPFACPANG